MHYTSLFIALATSVVAQDLGQLPACATACVGNSLSSTGCGQLNVSCICNSSGWIDGLTCCIAAGCSDADKAATIKFAQNICLPVGVQLPTAAVCKTSAAAPTATGASNPTTKTGTPASATSAAAKTSATAATASKAEAAPTGVALGFGAGVAGLAGILALAL